MAMLFDMMVRWSGLSYGIHMDGCIREVLEMMEKFMLDFFCNRMPLLNGK